MVRKNILEKVVSLLTRLQLIHKFLVSVFTAVSLETLVEVVHLNVTGIYKALALGGTGQEFQRINVGVCH